MEFIKGIPEIKDTLFLKVVVKSRASHTKLAANKKTKTSPILPPIAPEVTVIMDHDDIIQNKMDQTHLNGETD